ALALQLCGDGGRLLLRCERLSRLEQLRSRFRSWPLLYPPLLPHLSALYRRGRGANRDLRRARPRRRLAEPQIARQLFRGERGLRQFPAIRCWVGRAPRDGEPGPQSELVDAQDRVRILSP